MLAEPPYRALWRREPSTLIQVTSSVKPIVSDSHIQLRTTVLDNVRGPSLIDRRDFDPDELSTGRRAKSQMCQ